MGSAETKVRRSWVTSALAWSQERWPELGRIRRGLAAWKLLQDWGLGTWGPGDLGTWGWGDCDFVMGGGVECVELILANMGMIDGNWGIGRMRIEVLRLKLCCQGLLGDQDNTILSFQDSVGLPAVQHGQLRQPRVSERLG